jgi:hypothetical protein
VAQTRGRSASPLDCVMVPKRVLLLCGAFAAVRLAGFFAIYMTQSHDAQWQLSYLPLWISDFPVSLIYFWAALPIPAAEGIIGPIWWFFLPLGIWWTWRRWQSRRHLRQISVTQSNNRWSGP